MLDASEPLTGCPRNRYLDDELLTRDAVECLRQRNLGSRQIQLRLRRRGLDPEEIHSQLAQDPEAEREAALRARDAKIRLLSRETDPRKKREKLFRFLVGRGFPTELIFEVLEKDGDGASLMDVDDRAGE